ncbi:hypothetical protein Tco_0817635 [Tanacetum coccineum]
MGTFIQTPAEDAEETEGALQLVQDGRVVVQDVRGRYNANNQGRPFQRNNARGNVVAGNAGGQNRRMQCESLVKLQHYCYNYKGIGHIAENVHKPKRPQDSDYFKKEAVMLSEMDHAIAFDSDVDEAPTTQTMFMVNLSSEEAGPSYDSNTPFEIKNLEHQIQEKDNVIRDLKVLVSNVNDRSCEPYNANDVTDLLEQNKRLRAEIEKVKQHYKEMFESIKITCTSTNEKTSSLLTQIKDLKVQLEGNLKVTTRSSVKPKVLAPDIYAIDVKPISHPFRTIGVLI